MSTKTLVASFPNVPSGNPAGESTRFPPKACGNDPPGGDVRTASDGRGSACSPMNKALRHLRSQVINLHRSLLLKVIILLVALYGVVHAHTFELSGNNFLLDGKPFQIISGEVDYARIPRAYWLKRLEMARAMGLNTIATYVYWNYQEPEKGRFDFSGNRDIAAFVRDARKAGLWVLIRPSAYACAEWEFGGYPYWLLNEKGMKVRSRNPEYTKLIKAYYQEIGKQLAPLQITRGGPIIMVQVENEYGSYGDDKKYMEMNETLLREARFDVPFYTCDGIDRVPEGYAAGALPAIDGSINVKQIENVVSRYHDGHGPFFVAEWYPGWFDSWGEPYRKVSTKSCVEQLDTLLSHGLSLNMYMACGGTTRGFMNGANFSGSSPYSPQTSSYDYDAPINEAGHPTPKFYALRKVIEKFEPPGTTLPSVPGVERVIKIPEIKLNFACDILHDLPKPIFSERPLTFEAMHQAYGYVMYRTHVKGRTSGRLEIDSLRDFGIIFVNGKRTAVLDRRLNQESCQVSLADSSNVLDIFVENLGRINYGPYINDNYHGITNKVTLNGDELKGWEMYGFPFSSQPTIDHEDTLESQYPVIRRGSFQLGEIGDTYLDMRKWGKGVVWINRHNLGRYWDIGPQQTLYVPAPWLKKGRNTIVVLEELKVNQSEIRFANHPILNDLVNAKGS